MKGYNSDLKLVRRSTFFIWGYSRFQQRIRAEDNVSPGILDSHQGNKSLERQLLRTVLAFRHEEEKEKLDQKCKKKGKYKAIQKMQGDGSEDKKR